MKEKLLPIINWNKCDSDEVCVNVCVHGAMGITILTEEQFSTLSIIGKLKTKVHGKKKATLINPELCTGCGDCVKNCHEKAIKLLKRI